MPKEGVTPVLEVQNVGKSYGKLRALEGMNLEVFPGEIFALLGPNGAGKTTLIGCITGLISKFDGKINVAGKDVKRDARITRQLIGLVPQELNFDGFFTVEQVLYYQSGFFNKRPDKKKIYQILKDFGLYEKRAVNTRALSGGMKRRLMICKALMHDPILIFLDEPTAGVDVELRDELWIYVKKLQENGVTIVLTTHYLEEAEQLADRIGIINRGKLLMVKDREHILNELGKRWNRLSLKEAISEQLKAELNCKQISFPDSHTIHFDSEHPPLPSSITVQSIMDRIKASGNEILHIEGGRDSLERIFKEIVSVDSANGGH